MLYNGSQAKLHYILEANKIYGTTWLEWMQTQIHLCKHARAWASTPTEAEQTIRCGLRVCMLKDYKGFWLKRRRHDHPPFVSSSAPSTRTLQLIIDELMLVFTYPGSPGALPACLPLNVITLRWIRIRRENQVEFRLMKNMGKTIAGTCRGTCGLERQADTCIWGQTHTRVDHTHAQTHTHTHTHIHRPSWDWSCSLEQPLCTHTAIAGHTSCDNNNSPLHSV